MLKGCKTPTPAVLGSKIGTQLINRLCLLVRNVWIRVAKVLSVFGLVGRPVARLLIGAERVFAEGEEGVVREGALGRWKLVKPVVRIDGLPDCKEAVNLAKSCIMSMLLVEAGRRVGLIRTSGESRKPDRKPRPGRSSCGRC